MNLPCETPAGFLYDSREFLKAAELVLNRASGVSLPAYFLFSRSIELSLKAFLLSVGVAAKTLSSHKYGHNRVTLLAEATKNGLKDRVSIKTIEVGVIELLSQEYLSTRLGYRITNGSYYLPHIEMTEAVARKLVASLEFLCAPADDREA